MEISLTLPDGKQAPRTEIGMTTLDLATLDVTIEVVGYDLDNNKLVTVHVPYHIDEPRELARDEVESVVVSFFQKKQG